MEDIAPQLLEQLKKRFSESIAANPKIRALYKRIEAGEATYTDAEEYAYLIGQALSHTFGNYLSSDILPDGRMYFNIAERVIRPLLEEDHAIISEAAAMVQTFLNQQAGLGLKAQTVAVNADRIKGIIDKVSDAEVFDDVAWVLDEPVKNFSMNVVDETLKANVNFQGRSGLTPKIIRKSERKCCDWCAQLAGEYDYPDVPDEVYQRHERCRCTVEYDPADGKRKRQNVHTKKWTDSDDYDTLEVRKNVGRQSILSELAQHPKRLVSFTPSRLVAELEKEGLEIKPLARGSLKGIPFEEGGGFKVNFEDGGLFQYHPSDGSHHGGEYYKISTGKGGIKRYGPDGTEIKD